MLRFSCCAFLLLSPVWGSTEVRATTLSELWEGVAWGAPGRAALAHFGNRATVLANPIDFGDSYAELVLRDVSVGGVPLIAFLQVDKRTGGLKRIQLERQRHAVNPAAFRAVLAALQATYGNPDAACGAWPSAASGYQAAAERVWRRDGVIIRTIFRDTTIEAYEGCLAGDSTFGPCGLTGRLLVRISPPQVDGGTCAVPPPR